MEFLTDTIYLATNTAKCVECKRIFNLDNAAQANEWHYGHDCEA